MTAVSSRDYARLAARVAVDHDRAVFEALFDPAKSSLGTCLYRVTRNRRIDLLRRDKSDRIDPADPIFDPDAPEPADEAVDAERRDQRIQLGLGALPPEQIELVRRASVAGLSHGEIADKTGLPLGTVRSRIRLAFQKLRNILKCNSLVDTPKGGLTGRDTLL